MKRNILIFGALLMCSVFLQANEQVVVVKKDNSQAKGILLDVDGAGTLTIQDGQFKTKLKSSEYAYARIAQEPADYSNAEKLLKSGKFAEAEKLYSQVAASKYKFLGYELPALYGKATCLEKLGKDDDAIKILTSVTKSEPVDKQLDLHFYNSKRLLSDIYIKQNKFDLAYPVLTELGNTNSDNLAAYSFNARAEILTKQGKKKDAVLMYMRTALLFDPKISERGDSLVNIVKLLKEMNDTRAIKFEEMLKKEHPDKAK